MAESHVVSGLVEKRAELAGKIDHYRWEMARLVEEVGHLDATIKLFSPEYNPNSIRAITYRERNRFFTRENASGWCWVTGHSRAFKCVFDLVMRNGTSKSPFRTRSSTAY